MREKILKVQNISQIVEMCCNYNEHKLIRIMC